LQTQQAAEDGADLYAMRSCCVMNMNSKDTLATGVLLLPMNKASLRL
jgi:hypothetical protein